jgi:hypothetical protein
MLASMRWISKLDQAGEAAIFLFDPRLPACTTSTRVIFDIKGTMEGAW